MGDIKMWWEEQTRFKDDRVIVKLCDNNNNFIKSVIVPTVYYPLNSDYKAFHYKNTRVLEDDAVKGIFDSVKYQIGCCYQNTDNLVSALRDKGYNARSYVGWLFISNNQSPVHHCWCVLDDNIILDLADDYSVMLSGANGEHFKDKSLAEARELMVSFAEQARNVPNSVRCAPVGTPTPFMLYVGCECEPQGGRNIYNKLMRDFPRHECERNCDSSGYNVTQRMMKDKGLMQ